MNEQKAKGRKVREEGREGKRDGAKKEGNFSGDTNSPCIKQAGVEEATVIKAHEGYPAPGVRLTYPLGAHSTRCLKPDRSLPWLFQHQGGLECPHSSFFKGSSFPRTLAALCTQRHQGTGPREAVRSSLGESREGQGLPSSASASPHLTSVKDIFFVHLG